MLGNAIVPAAARLAFFRLYTAFEISSLADLKAREGTAISYTPGTALGVRHPAPHSTPHGSISTRNSVYAYPAPCQDGLKDWRIVLDPTHYKGVADKPSQRDNFHRDGVVQQSPLVTSRSKHARWATIRTSSGTGHVLTERMTRDVHTMARFAASVDGVKQPRTDRSKWLSVNYMEWMMGFPKDQTDF